MTREELLRYAAESYGTEPEYPWADDPEAAVLRHSLGRKWYGLVMRLPRRTLGLPGEGKIDVLNLKLDPALVYILREQAGYLPAYHMNKKHWLTVRLDGSVPPGRVKDLLDQSYDLTKKKMAPSHAGKGNDDGKTL